MSHAKKLSKLTEGLTALNDLVQASLEQDYSSERVELVASISEQIKKYADSLLDEKTKTLEAQVDNKVDAKIAKVSKKYAQLSEQVNSMDKPTFLDRELSGNKIHGGMITKFASTGISDEANKSVLKITNEGIVTDSIETSTVKGNITLHGDLTSAGVIKAKKLQVEEIESDTRLKRTTPLTFEATDGSVAQKGLLFVGDGHAKQFVFHKNPDAFFSSEDLNLFKDRKYKINGNVVLSATELGGSVVNSKLQTVGTIKNLKTSGDLAFDQYIFYESSSNRFGLGIDQPSGAFSIGSWNHEFLIDENTDSSWKVGSNSNADVKIITNNMDRISISKIGKVVVHISIDTPELNVTNHMMLSTKKFTVAKEIPTRGSYSLGDIVWNEYPQSRGYIGWVCTRAGSPGDWKPFGVVS